MTKMLIALDESPSAMKAVEYVAQYFGRADDIEVRIVHVLPNLPAIFWDEGHILSDGEKQDRKKVVDKWLVTQKTKIEPLFSKAANVLIAKGIPAERIGTKFVSDSTDVASSILEEAKDSDCRSIVVGRSHHSPKHVLGTVAGRIAGQGAGLVVTIVE
jgi:nucleotide-binding universal stress UspA family protein